MGMCDTKEEDLAKIHQELCNKLNLDVSTTTASWDTYESISKKFALEGDKVQWLGCAIYVAAQRVETPTLDNSSVVRGMGINLTTLLRHSNLSFVQFFSNIARWAEMAQLPDEFRAKIAHLRSNFSITCNTFKKLHPLFCEIFVAPVPNSQDIEAAKHRNRKNRPLPCTSIKVFEFVWNLFVTLKAEEPSCSTELIKSHHLLYCCIDLAFKNAVASERKDLINNILVDDLLQNTSELRALNEAPCMVNWFCKDDSLVKDALHMKVYIFRRLINKLIENNRLIADKSDFTGIFDPENFSQNFRNVMKAYETHLLNCGDFDERIFLAEFKRCLMENEQAGPSWTSMKTLPPGDSADASLLESPKTNPRGLDTPLTGRNFLGPRDGDGRSTSEKISRLHSMIGTRISAPSENLKILFESCQQDPLPKIQDIFCSMKDKFIEAYITVNVCLEEAQNWADLAVTLSYKYIELILNKEKSITSDISALVEKDIFYQCMFACCLEIVLYCYNFPKKFPWVLDTVGVEPIHFVKVIELIVRTKDNLFRELIKHLNRIEETVIESLAWRSNSPIWEAIEKTGQGIPKFQDTALPGHILYNDASDDHLLQSPRHPSASDCFQSPLSDLCRSLFPASGSALQLKRSSKSSKYQLVPIVDEDDSKAESPVPAADFQVTLQPRRTGSVSIVFRKFYNLAGVRMQHLWTNLGFEDTELRKKIWTIFEDSIRHTDLLKDRHLDQLIMCAIYVICKAGNITMPNLFSIIMKFYRQQPQASSVVYRDVLIEREKTSDEGIFIPEERGDLIQFYNSVYVNVMETYAVRFQPNKISNTTVPLSPLPANRRNLASSNLQVVSNVFVKPLESTSAQSGSSFNYYFSRSPSKDLMNINRAINSNGIQGKRLLTDDGGNIPTNKKTRKIQTLVEDRQRQNASQ